MRLVRPSVEWKEEHENYVKECGTSRLTPSSFNLEGHESYEAYLKAMQVRERGDEKRVPSTKYFLVDNGNRVLGMIDIRHRLTDYLFQVGGHIGYSVRPSERRKGYATRMLAEALQKCKALGITRVLITCDKDNIGSAKTIIKNDGVEDDCFIEEDGNVVRRFWIDIY